MKQFLSACVFAAAMFLAAPAGAQTSAYSAEHLALAREVVTAAGSEDILAEMTNGLAPQLAAEISAAGADQAVAARYVDIFLEEFAAEAPQILELTAIAYAGAFNEAQLRDLLVFYRSDTGRALVAKLPELTVAMTRAGSMIGAQVAERAAIRLQAENGRAPINP